MIDLIRIVSDASLAPSGENCQPWRFHKDGDILYISNDPHADTSIYNTRQKGSLVAIGAAIENAVISASAQGYRAEVSLFPETNDRDLVARISFSRPCGIDELYGSLEKRCTNRKAYTGEKLNELEKSSLIAAALARGAECAIVDDPSLMKRLGSALSVNERLLFENKLLHDFFYGHILWDESEQGKRSGFYFETLEFLPHQLKAVKLLKYWSILRLLNATIGIGKLIAKENGEKYAASGSLLAITVKNGNAQGYVEAGRAVERVWLTATNSGLSVHPCTGVLYFLEQIRDGGEEYFSPSQIRLIKEAYGTIEEGFRAHGKTIPMLMRVGRAEQPTARASRITSQIQNYYDRHNKSGQN